MIYFALLFDLTSIFIPAIAAVAFTTFFPIWTVNEFLADRNYFSTIITKESDISLLGYWTSSK